MTAAKKKTVAAGGRKIIARNRRAFHDYHVSDRYEAGLVLRGTEVKSLREGRANLADAYAEVKDGELFLVQSHISEYPQASYLNHEPRRTRKLLLHQAEIRKIATKIRERGFTLIAIELYFVRGKAKVELGLAKGKRQYDKRETVRRRDQERDGAAQLRRR